MSTALVAMLTDIGWPQDVVRLADRCAAEMRERTQREVSFTITPGGITITPCLDQDRLPAELRIAVIANDSERPTVPAPADPGPAPR